MLLLKNVKILNLSNAINAIRFNLNCIKRENFNNLLNNLMNSIDNLLYKTI